MNLAQNSGLQHKTKKKGLHCRISQKVYLEPKWLRCLIEIGALTQGARTTKETRTKQTATK